MVRFQVNGFLLFVQHRMDQLKQFGTHVHRFRDVIPLVSENLEVTFLTINHSIFNNLKKKHFRSFSYVLYTLSSLFLRFTPKEDWKL